MRELEVALAIALSFLIFSTLSSMILEVLFRFSKTRFKGLQRMLTDFYHAELSQLNLQTADKTDFSGHILRLNGQSHSLSKRQFVERLATSQVGKVIAAHAQKNVDILIADIARRYDEYGKAASFKFRQLAEQANMVIAVIIALLLNVNAITLGNAFLDNRALTTSIVAKTEAILHSAEVQQQNLKQAFGSQEDLTTNELSRSIDNIRQQLNEAQTLSLPIGWSRKAINYFETGAARVACVPKRWLAEHNQQFELCDGTFGAIAFYAFAIFSWFITTVITGLLIGLGGPFWFDMVKRIVVIRSFFGQKSSAQVAETSTSDKPNPTNAELTLAFQQAYAATTLRKLTINAVRPLYPKGVRLGKIVND